MSFAEFYALYPRKMARKDAEKAWRSLSLADQQSALEALPNHLAYWKLKQTEKDYIAYPASWLRGYRFQDELDMEVKKDKKPALPFYATEELTMQKAREVGITPYAGEAWAALRMRISNKIKQLDEQT